MIVLLALRDRLELCFGLNNPALKNILWLRSDPGGGGTTLYQVYRYVPLQRVWFLSRLKTI